MTTFPQWCLVCARQAWDNSCGHFTGPVPYTSCTCTGCLLSMPDMCDRGYPTTTDLARMDLAAWIKRQREALPERREEWAHGAAQVLHDLTLELDRIFGPQNLSSGVNAGQDESSPLSGAGDSRGASAAPDKAKGHPPCAAAHLPKEEGQP